MIYNSNIIYLKDFSGKDDREIFANAISYMKAHPATTLIVEPRIYTITSELAKQAQSNVMEGVYGEDQEREIFNPHYKYTRGIHFDGLKDCKIEAYGAALMVDGFMEPISITNCQNVEVCGFTVDHKRKPFSKAIVTHTQSLPDTSSRRLFLEFDEDCPIKRDTPCRLRYVLYDPVTDELAWADYIEEELYSFIDERHVSLIVDDLRFGVGSEFYTTHTYHSRPAVLIENSLNVTLNGVTVHSQPGMGIVGNRSENIALYGVEIVPSKGHKISTNTDATHFTSIKGKLTLENCRFIGCGDDFTNIHGYYQKIIKRVSPRVCYIQEKTPDGTHAQTLDYPDIGDTLELSSFKTLETLDTFRVIDVEPLFDEWKCKITLDHDLPENTDNTVMCDVTRLPEVEIRGCYAADHYARGAMIKTRSALIENNLFHNVDHTAILVASEASWFEGATPANVTIQNNVITDSRSSDKVAGISVRVKCDTPSGCPIKNIRILNNVIHAPRCDHAIELKNIDGVFLSNNICTVQNEPVIIKNCTNITISEE